MADEEDLARLHAGERDVSQSDFRRADLSGFDFRGRDLTGARLEESTLIGANFENCDLTSIQLHQAQASRANFSGSSMPNPMVGVDFSEANLRSANFGGRIIANCKFSSADLGGANFKDARLQDDTTFDHAIVDSATDFDNAQVLRSLSRLPIFRGYHFERGFLKKEPIVEIEAELQEKPVKPEIVDGAATENNAAGTTDSSIGIQRIRSILVNRPSSIRDMAASLAVAVREHMDLVAGNKPNDQYNLKDLRVISVFLSRYPMVYGRLRRA